MKGNYGLCQYDHCIKDAEYGLYRQTDSDKKFIYVCKKHQFLIAQENIKGTKNDY